MEFCDPQTLALHLFKSLTFLSKVWQISVFRSYISSVNFFPKYFHAVVNGIFLFSFLNCSLVAYRNKVDLSINLVLRSLAELIYQFWQFFYGFLTMFLIPWDFSTYRIMSSANKDHFTSFPIWMSFIFFFFPDGTGQKLQYIDESRHPRLFSLHH